MKTFKFVLLVTGILVAGLAFSASAQTRSAKKTSSAKAYYGHKPGKQKPHFKKVKRNRENIIKPARMKNRVQAKDGYVRKRHVS